MNLTYDITTVLANFDALNPVLLVSYGLTLACFVVYYIAAIIKGFKDKHCGMPWQTNMWNMSNDFLFVFLGFPYWWTEGLQTNHWFTHIIWVGMVAWFAAELICHWQTIKWDLGEIFPHAKKRSNAIACYIGAQVVFVACYYWIWSSIDILHAVRAAVPLGAQLDQGCVGRCAVGRPHRAGCLVVLRDTGDGPGVGHDLHVLLRRLRRCSGHRQPVEVLPVKKAGVNG